MLWRPTRPSRTNTPKKDVLFIIGGWNAKVGSQEIPGVTSKFSLGVLNEAGERLVEFCQENTLVIANTLFQKHNRRLYTCTSPDGQHRNQIDYILCSQRWRGFIRRCKLRVKLQQLHACMFIGIRLADYAKMMWLDKRAIQTQTWVSQVWGAMPTPDLTHGTQPHQHPEVDGSADGALDLSPGSWTQMTLQGRFQDIILFQNLVSFKADLKEKRKKCWGKRNRPSWRALF